MQRGDLMEQNTTDEQLAYRPINPVSGYINDLFADMCTVFERTLNQHGIQIDDAIRDEISDQIASISINEGDKMMKTFVKTSLCETIVSNALITGNNVNVSAALEDIVEMHRNRKPDYGAWNAAVEAMKQLMTEIPTDVLVDRVEDLLIDIEGSRENER